MQKELLKAEGVRESSFEPSRPAVRLKERERSLLEIIVVDDEGIAQDSPLLPESLPSWAMDFATHSSTFQRTAIYRCTDPACAGEHEEYRQNPRRLPYAKVCGVLREKEDGSIFNCVSSALRRVTYPGEGAALNARRFEPLVVYERANHESLPRGLDRYYIPGQNNEPTEPGMKRIELTNIQDYNRFVKNVNAYETQKMRDHREMHREYWKSRRKAMRDDVNARIRHSPLLLSLARLVRARSDRKTGMRYGKALDAHFHAQLIEFDQGKIQDWCSENTGWKARRAR